jgi:drug/metabolite transporter (DMT)-like permease
LTGEAFGAACALAAAFCWALTSMLVRRLGAVSHMMTVNAVRITSCGLVLLGITLMGSARDEYAAMSATTLLMLVSSTVLAAGIGDSIFFECTRILGLGRAMTLAMTYPLMAAGFAAAFLDEPITVRSMAGTITTLVGLILIIGPRTGTPETNRRQRLAILASFFVAITWAASAILMKPPMREMSPLAAQALRMPLVGAFLWLMPWSRAGLPGLYVAGRGIVAPMVMLTVLTGVSSMAWIAGIKYTDIVVATVLSSTSPLFALALGGMFLGERVTLGAALGAVLAIAGIVILKV